MTPAQSVIGRVRSVIEWVLSRSPVELASVDYNASDSCAVATEPFGERVNDNISAVLDGLGEVGGGKCRVYDQGNPAGLGMP
jgi:hypothetical protein